MDPERIRNLLGEVQRGGRTVEEALVELKDLPFRNLEYARADTHRHLRTGFPEVVFGLGKTAEQIGAILIELARGGSPVFATRVVAAEAPGIVTCRLTLASAGSYRIALAGTDGLVRNGRDYAIRLQDPSEAELR